MRRLVFDQSPPVHPVSESRGGDGPLSRAPENLKLAGNWPKMAAMCGLQDYKKKHICVVFKLIIPITVVFMHLFWAFRPIWLAISISGISFWLLDTYFWSYFSWLAKIGCQNLKLAGNTFPPFWSPAPERDAQMKGVRKSSCLILDYFSHIVQYNGLIWVKEEGRTEFSEGWQGCFEVFPKGKARGKSWGAALPARGKPSPSRLFYSGLHSISNTVFWGQQAGKLFLNTISAHFWWQIANSDKTLFSKIVSGEYVCDYLFCCRTSVKSCKKALKE